MKEIDLSGIWQCTIDGQTWPLSIPGTLELSGIGVPDDPLRQWKVDEVRRIGFYHDGDPIVTRLTRSHIFEGCATITKHLEWTLPAECRIFLDVERARFLRLFVNGQEAVPIQPFSLSVPWSFEITNLVTGTDTIAFQSDNQYKRWPRESIVYSSAASDETQTNWNGLLGYVRLRIEQCTYFSDLRVYPHRNTLTVCAEIDSNSGWCGDIMLHSSALSNDIRYKASTAAGRQEIWIQNLPLSKEAAKWDLDEGILVKFS